MNSIIVNRGTIIRGQPDGTKNEKNFNLWILKPKIVTPIKIVILKPNTIIAEVVITNE